MKGTYYMIPALLLVLPAIMYAQTADTTHWTLERCVEYALKHNIELNAEKLTLKECDISVSDGKMAFVPRISTSTYFNMSIGRVLDETTYDFVTSQSVGSSTASLSVNVPIFDGLRNVRQLQAAKIDKYTSELKVEKASNDLILNITACFLEVLCARENITNCESLVKSLHQQELHTERKVEAGKVTYVDLLQVRSRLAEAENALLMAVHSYDVLRLKICQLLEIEDYACFIPCADEYENISCVTVNYMSIWYNACRLPQIRMAENALELSRKNIQIARSSYYPSLSFSVGYGSSYSTARQDIIMSTNNKYTYKTYPFFDQYRDNANGYVSFGLSIPILNGMTARNRVRKAKLDLKRSEYALASTYKQLRKDVLQAIMDAETAWGKYMGSVRYLESSKEVLRQIGLKYEAGAANMTEYTTAVSAMSEAQCQYLSSKYEYIFREKVLLFYENSH